LKQSSKTFVLYQCLSFLRFFIFFKRFESLFDRYEGLVFIHKSISAAKLPYREAVRDHSPGLLGLGFCQKQFALKGRPNAMIFRHGSQGIHFHPFPSVAPSASGRISSQA
jgi:hypothetical protein